MKNVRKQATELSAKLKPITERQKDWAASYLGCFYRSSRNTRYCLECGHSWKEKGLANHDDNCTCPNCGKKLEYTKSFKDSAYFSIIQAKDGVQVVRMFWVQKCFYRNTPACSWASEVMQHFIFSDGDTVTLSKQVNGLSQYFDVWVHGSELRIRSSRSYWADLRFGLGPYMIYPKRTYISELKRNGFNGNFNGFTPQRFASLILSSPIAETLLKTKQKALFRSIPNGLRDIKKRWSSIRICIRNGYVVKDASMWFDYISILEYLGKDILNSYYACPENLKKAHDHYLKKKKEQTRKIELKKMKERIDEAQIEYEKKKKRFFGVKFIKDNLTVMVLENVGEFLNDGLILNHCVFENKYYEKENSLILSARIKNEPVETVEISLSDMRIVQARGENNKPSKYHEDIISIVNQNMNVIAKKYGNN